MGMLLEVCKLGMLETRCNLDLIIIHDIFLYCLSDIQFRVLSYLVCSYYGTILFTLSYDILHYRCNRVHAII